MRRKEMINPPWNVGGKEPSVRVSNSTESILYLGICSSMMGFAIFFAVLQMAYIDHWKETKLKKNEGKNLKYHKNMSTSTSPGM